MAPLKIRKVGGAKGVILPKELLDRLKVKEGDKLYVTETPDGYRLTPYDPEFERQMNAAREVMHKWRPVLRELAK